VIRWIIFEIIFTCMLCGTVGRHKRLHVERRISSASKLLKFYGGISLVMETYYVLVSVSLLEHKDTKIEIKYYVLITTNQLINFYIRWHFSVSLLVWKFGQYILFWENWTAYFNSLSMYLNDKINIHFGHFFVVDCF
jgi:hypothetical protein